VLREKIKNDPLGIAIYEKEEWVLYSRITELKDKYYNEKIHVSPELNNVYITFRSMEGKQRALQAYNISPFRRLFSEICCGMRLMLRKKKLLMQGFYRIKEAEVPENIIWENLGVKWQSKFVRFLAGLVPLLLCIVFSLVVLSIFVIFEKQKNEYIIGECNPS
jgi:hypothetical protein